MADETTPAGGAPEGIPGADTAAPSLEEMAQALADSKIRATLSQWEQELNARMAAAEKAFADQQASMASQMTFMQGQLAAVRQQAGPPEAVTLSASLAERVKSIGTANPDLGKLHFAGLISQGERLAEAVKAVAGGTGTVQEAELLVHGMTSWFERTHPRVSGKFLEGGHAALDELERIAEGLAELAPVAAAIASAV